MFEQEPFSVLKTTELRGAEKLYSLHGNWSWIVHIAHLSQTDPIQLTDRLDSILQQLLKRHVRLRSRLRIVRMSTDAVDQSEPVRSCGEEQVLLDLVEYDDDVFARQDILRRFYSIYQGDEPWTKLAEDLADRNPHNDTSNSLFPLFHLKFVMTSSDPKNFHLILLTHHSVSDGMSGFIILHDYLTLASQDALMQCNVRRDIPPDLLDRMSKPYGFLYPWMSKVASLIYIYQMKSHQRQIPIASDDQRHPSMQPIRTRFLFTSCSEEHYQRLHRLCQTRKITLHGPLFACLILAIQQSFFRSSLTSSKKLTQIHIDINYNMRTRLLSDTSLRDTVGYYVAVNSIDFSRIPLSESFWSLARYCYEQTQKVASDRDMLFNTHHFADIIADQTTFVPSIVQASKGNLSEMTYSNLGKYPYDHRTYSNIHLDGIHLASSSAIYHSSFVVYVTCVEHLDVSLAHRLSDDEPARAFLSLYKRLIERCCDFSSDLTLADIFDQLTRRDWSFFLNIVSGKSSVFAIAMTINFE